MWLRKGKSFCNEFTLKCSDVKWRKPVTSHLRKWFMELVSNRLLHFVKPVMKHSHGGDVSHFIMYTGYSLV